MITDYVRARALRYKELSQGDMPSDPPLLPQMSLSPKHVFIIKLFLQDTVFISIY